MTGASSRKRGQGVRTLTCASGLGRNVHLDDPGRSLRVDDLDVDDVAHTESTGTNTRLGPYASRRSRQLPVTHEVERRQLATFEDLEPDLSMSLQDVLRMSWRHISDPSLWPNERLFFEVCAQALQNRPAMNEFLADISSHGSAPR